MAIFISVVGSEACCGASLMKKEHSPDSRLLPGSLLTTRALSKGLPDKSSQVSKSSYQRQISRTNLVIIHQLCSSLFNSIDASCLHAKILTLDPPSADDFIQTDVL